MKLTDKAVDRLPIPPSGNTRTPDSEVPGLYAQITAAGRRGFVMRYRIEGRQQLYTIGSRPAWSVSAARERAKELRRLIDQGVDPQEQKAQSRAAAITLAEYWERVYEPLHVTTKRARYARDMRSMMARDILPHLGDRALRDIDDADVGALHRRISNRAPMRANRVLSLLSHMMNFAERPRILETGERVPALRPPSSNPVRGIAKNDEVARERYLRPAEMQALAAVLAGHRERTSVALVTFLWLTGARFSEAANATWDQFEGPIWTKPSSHTKQKRLHRVPLSAPAVALLRQLREAGATNQYLFPGPTGQPLTTIKTFWRSVTRQAGLEDLRVHDLRHSFASVLASSGASLPLIGQLLGHTQNQTTMRYAHLLDDAQREAVERAGAMITDGAA